MCGALSGRYQTERACVERIEFYSRGKKRERKFYKQGSLTIRFVCYMSIVIDLITGLRVLESKRGVLCLFNWRCSGCLSIETTCANSLYYSYLVLQMLSLSPWPGLDRY